MPGKIGHLRPLCMYWYHMGVDLRFLGLNKFHPDTMRHAVFHSFSMFFIVFAFAMIWRYHWFSLHFFPVLWVFPSVFLWISMCICGALQSSTVYLCAGGRCWQCLGGRLHVWLPGWAHQRGQCWHLSDEIRCPGRPPVDGALQADGVRLRFRIFSMEEKHGKTLDPLARSMFPVM